MRYCEEIIKTKDYSLARRYLSLATVFDPDISKKKRYIMLHEFVSSCGAIGMAWQPYSPDRGFSYDPPEGSIKIDRSSYV